MVLKTGFHPNIIFCDFIFFCVCACVKWHVFDISSDSPIYQNVMSPFSPLLQHIMHHLSH